MPKRHRPVGKKKKKEVNAATSKTRSQAVETSRAPRIAYMWDHSYELSFHDYDDVNVDLSIDMKKVALRTSPSVVGVDVYSGEERLFFCSGIIFESHAVDDCHSSRILSSAVFMKDPANLRIRIHLRGGKICEGRVLAVNTAYCIIILEIKSDVPLHPIKFKEIDDVVRVNSKELDIKSFELRPHRINIKVIPGEIVMALGRSHQGNSSLMAAAGPFSIECCKLDCQELLRVNCRISQAGIGGPIVNGNGDVIGISFYSEYCTPFLPGNIILKWLDQIERSLAFPRPQLGLQVANLYTASNGIWGRIFQKFPDISSGVIVEKIKERFGIAGIRTKDVIVECCGSKIESLLQLLDIAREKVGEHVELLVVRPAEGVRLHLSGVLAQKSSLELNSWPLPGKCMRVTSR